MGQGPNNAYVASIRKLVNNVAANVFAPLALDAQSAMQVGQQHGDYLGAGVAGRIFLGANQAGATLSAALATTYVGLCLSNPAGSGKNLALQRVSGAIAVAPAAVLALGLIGGFAAGGVTVHTTPVTPLTSVLGGAALPVAKLDAAATLVGTPAWVDWLTNNAASAGLPFFGRDYRGSIIIPPGGYVAIGGSVAGPTSGFFGAIEWEEVALPV